MICANPTVRRQVEEGIIVSTIVMLSTGSASIRLVAGTFDRGSRPDVDLDDTIEELSR